MNNPNSNSDEPFGLSDEETQQLHYDLGEIYRLPVPVIHFDPLTAPACTGPSTVKRSWRPVLIAGAAAAALALFLAGPSLFGASPAEVSAEQIFERTKEVAATSYATINDESYHLIARSDFNGRQGSSTITETWYGDGEHQRTETRDAETGEVLFGHLQQGDDFWLYADVDGELRAVHSSLEGPDRVFSVGGAGVFSSRVTDLSELLSTFTNECSEARSLGEDVVAGRPVYLIEVTSKPDTCKWEAITIGDPDGEGASLEVHVEGVGQGAGAVRAGEGPVTGGTIAVARDGSEPEVRTFVTGGPMRMWIDQETFMTLKSESSFGDELSHSYEVTTLEVGLDLSGDLVFELPEWTGVVEAGSPEDATTRLKGMFQFSPVGGVEFTVENVPEKP